MLTLRAVCPWRCEAGVARCLTGVRKDIEEATEMIQAKRAIGRKETKEGSRRDR